MPRIRLLICSSQLERLKGTYYQTGTFCKLTGVDCNADIRELLSQVIHCFYLVYLHSRIDGTALKTIECA